MVSDIIKRNKDIKNSIKHQAKNIPNALLKINYYVVSVKESEVFIEFTAKELEILAKNEHMSWYRHRKKCGWKYGEVNFKLVTYVTEMMKRI